jgi:voltage-gated potassium channel
MKTFTVDEFGVKNYNSFYLLLITIGVLYGVIALLSIPLFHYESEIISSNIKTYKDAFWTLQMSASTIGFGDFFPVSFEGRIIVAAMFYIGVGMVGFVGAQFVNKFVGFSDTNVKNRELRKQNKNFSPQFGARRKD